jgi:two-component system, NarL family, response regulator LiaR
MTEKPIIRVLVADDHAMVRMGITTMLEAFSDLALVGEATNGDEALRRCKETQPDIVLMDIVMPQMDGIAAMQTIQRKFAGIKVIALTSFEEASMVQAALQAGAVGYLLKNISAQDLAEAIRSAYNGRSVLSPEATQILVDVTRQPQTIGQDLTERELTVLKYIVRGLSNNEIAVHLSVSQFTIKNHVSNILAKLGVMSRTEAATLALQRRLVQLD